MQAPMLHYEWCLTHETQLREQLRLLAKRLNQRLHEHPLHMVLSVHGAEPDLHFEVDVDAQVIRLVIEPTTRAMYGWLAHVFENMGIAHTRRHPTVVNLESRYAELYERIRNDGFEPGTPDDIVYGAGVTPKGILWLDDDKQDGETLPRSFYKSRAFAELWLHMHWRAPTHPLEAEQLERTLNDLELAYQGQDLKDTDAPLEAWNELFLIKGEESLRQMRVSFLLGAQPTPLTTQPIGLRRESVMQKLGHAWLELPGSTSVRWEEKEFVLRDTGSTVRISEMKLKQSVSPQEALARLADNTQKGNAQTLLIEEAQLHARMDVFSDDNEIMVEAAATNGVYAALGTMVLEGEKQLEVIKDIWGSITWPEPL